MAEVLQTAMPENPNLFLGHNGEFWDFWLIISVVIAAVAAAAIGVTTAGSVISHKREASAAEEELEKYKLSTNLNIKEAEARALEAQAELAKFKAPRSMTPEQQMRIVGKLAGFKGTRFDMSVLASDPEAAIFLGQVSKTLQLAGWEWVEWAHPSGPITLTYGWPGLPNVGQMGGVGIEIFVHPDHAEQFREASTSLAKTLAAEGFSNGTVTDSVGEQGIPSNDTLHIVIGKKPL